MATTCPDCGRAFTRDRPAVESITGRHICADCRDGTLAAAAGAMANPTGPVQGAIATQGWFQRLRARRGAERSSEHRPPSDPEREGRP